MNMYVTSVYDKKVGTFGPPQFYRSKGEATRSFMDAVNQEAFLKRHAEDYVFMYLGTFDDSAGIFVQSQSGPEPLMQALDCIVIEGKVN